MFKLECVVLNWEGFTVSTVKILESSVSLSNLLLNP